MIRQTICAIHRLVWQSIPCFIVQQQNKSPSKNCYHGSYLVRTRYTDVFWTFTRTTSLTQKSDARCQVPKHQRRQVCTKFYVLVLILLRSFGSLLCKGLHAHEIPVLWRYQYVTSRSLRDSHHQERHHQLPPTIFLLLVCSDWTTTLWKFLLPSFFPVWQQTLALCAIKQTLSVTQEWNDGDPWPQRQILTGATLIITFWSCYLLTNSRLCVKIHSYITTKK
jgi:hypothetical protein